MEPSKTLVRSLMYPLCLCGASSPILIQCKPSSGAALMNVQRLTFAAIVLFIPCLLVLSGCKQAHEEANAGAPPAAQVTPVGDAALFSVDHPEQFPLAAATERPATSELVVTGTVTADVS